MSRANRARGEDVPPGLVDRERPALTLESLFALCLCAVVVLASAAFLRRSSALTRALAEFQGEKLLAPPRARQTVVLGTGAARPELVLLIVLDGLRADRLAPQADGPDAAPHLRALAAEGLAFETVGAQAAHPLASHKSLMTGKYPATLMLEETGADLPELTAVEDPRTYLVETFSAVEGELALGFQRRGYRTAGFTDGGWLSRTAGFAHGFESFDDAGGGLGALLQRALTWLEKRADEPAFLFLAARDLACPYDGPAGSAGAACPDHGAHAALAELCAQADPDLAPADRAALVAHYDGALLAADEELGRFLDVLRARKLYERTLVVVTSSHGESLGEHGRIGHGGLFLEQLLVPLLVKPPRAAGLAPTRVSEPVELVDLQPTLFALCGIPDASAPDGRSLLPTILRGVRGRDHLVAETGFEEARGASPARRTLLRPGRWQVIHDVARAQADFYALGLDPQGLVGHPIAEREFAPLLELLLERGAPVRRARLRPQEPVHFAPELQRELEALGYTTAAAGPEHQPDLR